MPRRNKRRIPWTAEEDALVLTLHVNEVVDVLPGIVLDLMAGGMFRDEEQLGNFTTTSIESYWIGLGLTWRFGRGSCCRLSAPGEWRCK